MVFAGRVAAHRCSRSKGSTVAFVREVRASRKLSISVEASVPVEFGKPGP